MMKERKTLFDYIPHDALSSAIAIFAGLAVGFIVLLISNPAAAAGGFGTILTGGFRSMKDFGDVLYGATPIIMTGLSVGFASRTGLFNIGASGQFIVGAYVAILVGVKCTFLPGWSHWIVAILAAVVAGALWGLIPGILKAYCNVNEVIACIMTNYIGMYMVNYLIKTTCYDNLRNLSQPVVDTAKLPKAWLDKLFRTGMSSSSANIGIIFAVLVAVLMYIILEKTVFGYELKACGFNSEAARYAGINQRRGIVFSMVIAGALAGLGGALLYLAGSGKSIPVVDILAPEGFNGIPVALLGLNNPIGIIFAGLFVSHLTVGGFYMQLHSFTSEIIDIIIAIIIYFSAFSLLIKGIFQNIQLKRESAAAENLVSDSVAEEEREL
ncbi:MAG: ABC transporter permease [Oscillospiraceae bacterium]|nr:ABC transporter permease [Oscillospiraceae bacterium]